MDRVILFGFAFIFSVHSVTGRFDLLALQSGDSDLGELTKEIVTDEPVTKPNIKVLSLHVVTDIEYRYAITRVTSRVANHDNVSREVVFSLVVPESAFVSKFFMEINNKTYDAYIKEKEEAKQEYNQAVAHGQAAAHVELSARDSNTFRVSVNVEPQTKVNFGMSYEQLLARTLGRYEQVVNINPGQLVKNMTVIVNILESNNITELEVPELKTSNEITDEKETPNKLAAITRPTGKSATIRWEPTLEDQEKMNKDFGVKGQLIVRYDVDRSENPDQILVDEGYFVHLYAPADLPTLSKHAIFVLDLSGSMFGTKLSQLKDAMTEILSELRDEDYFSIILFSNRAHVWSLDSSNETTVMLSEDAAPQNLTFKHHVMQASPDNIRRAKEAIKEMQDHGGTNIIDGLRKAIEMAQVGRASFENKVEMPEPIVIFLTDGEPNVEMSDTEEIIKNVNLMNKNKYQVFSLAFGNGADYNFLRKLSLANSAFARNIYEASDAALQLRNFYKQVASPLLSNVTFNYLPGQVDFNTTTKTHFSTLYSGSELVVAGKLHPSDQKDELKRLSGNVAGRGANGTENFVLPEVQNVTNQTLRGCVIDFIPIEHFVEENRTQGHLERVWAYLYVQQLLDENSLDEAKINASKAKALKLSLDYSFVTPLTSLVVVKPNDTNKAVDSMKNGANGETEIAAYKVGMASSNIMPAALNVGFGGFAATAAAGPPGFIPHAYFTSLHKRPAVLSAVAPQYSPIVGAESATYSSGSVIFSDDVSEEKYPPGMKDAFENYAKLHNLTLAQGSEVTSTRYQECANSSSPSHNSSSPHHCQHVQTCLLPEITIDMKTYEPYHCVIENKYLGVCCPPLVVPLNTAEDASGNPIGEVPDATSQTTETSKVVAPETPKVAAPETPKVAAPETSKVAAPETSKVAAPETPKAAAPENSKVAALETPKVAATESPKTSKPAKPVEPSSEKTVDLAHSTASSVPASSTVKAP